MCLGFAPNPWESAAPPAGTGSINGMEISQATQADIPAIAELMTASFADDPVMHQFFSHAGKRHQAMLRVFTLELERFYLPLGVVDVVRTERGVVGTALWAKPNVSMKKIDEAILTVHLARALGRHVFQYLHLDRFDSPGSPKVPSLVPLHCGGGSVRARAGDWRKAPRPWACPGGGHSNLSGVHHRGLAKAL